MCTLVEDLRQRAAHVPFVTTSSNQLVCFWLACLLQSLPWRQPSLVYGQPGRITLLPSDTHMAAQANPKKKRQRNETGLNGPQRRPRKCVGHNGPPHGDRRPRPGAVAPRSIRFGGEETVLGPPLRGLSTRLGRIRPAAWPSRRPAQPGPAAWLPWVHLQYRGGGTDTGVLPSNTYLLDEATNRD